MDVHAQEQFVKKSLLACVLVHGEELESLLGSGRSSTMTFDMVKHPQFYSKLLPPTPESKVAPRHPRASVAVMSNATASQFSGKITLRGCPADNFEINIYSARRLEFSDPSCQPFAVVYWNNEEIGIPICNLTLLLY